MYNWLGSLIDGYFIVFSLNKRKIIVTAEYIKSWWNPKTKNSLSQAGTAHPFLSRISDRCSKCVMVPTRWRLGGQLWVLLHLSRARWCFLNGSSLAGGGLDTRTKLHGTLFNCFPQNEDFQVHGEEHWTAKFRTIDEVICYRLVISYYALVNLSVAVEKRINKVIRIHCVWPCICSTNQLEG